MSNLERFTLGKQLENQGGMGYVVFAHDTQTNTDVVIKFSNCRDEEDLSRFRREVRLLVKYSTSGFVIPVIHHDLTCDRPYFVMPKAESDLTSLFKVSIEEKEVMFKRMLDCLEFIHNQGELHRDIKPENFLVLNGKIVVSDLGLAKDPFSSTQFTKSIHIGGSPIYAPPDFFLRGGFMNADKSDDLFSIGKSFLFLFTGIKPQYIQQGDTPSVIFEVIKRATELKREHRFQNCEELRKSMKEAFDIVLQRIDSSLEYIQLKTTLSKILSPDNVNIENAKKFLNYLSDKTSEEKTKVFEKHSHEIFTALSLSRELSVFANKMVDAYREVFNVTTSQRYWSFSYAEIVANDIGLLFKSSHINSEAKIKGLQVAIDFAVAGNRGAAAETCADIIHEIKEDNLAYLIGALVPSYKNSTFKHHLSADKCQHFHLMKIIEEYKENN